MIVWDLTIIMHNYSNYEPRDNTSYINICQIGNSFKKYTIVHDMFMICSYNNDEMYLIYLNVLRC